MADAIQYDIIIPVYVHTEDLLEMTLACFESIMRSTDKARIILIDNASPKKYGEEMERLLIQNGQPVLYYRMPDNLGFVKGTNMGLAASTAPYVVFQNNDTIVYGDIYDRMQRVAEQPGVGVVGTPSSSGWQAISSLCAKWKLWDSMHIDQMPPDQVAKTLARAFDGQIFRLTADHGMVAFFCTMIPRQVIECVGYLSEEYGMGMGDDDDYCARVKAAGYGVYLALDCYCHHHHRKTWRSYRSEREIGELHQNAYKQLRKKYDWVPMKEF